MPPLLVIPAMPRTMAAERQALPTLPALGELLRLSDPADPDASWRSGLLRDLGLGHAAPPEAVVAARALELAQGTAACLAAPVHAVAGLHRVHMHAAGILVLPEEERSELAAGFAAQFGPGLQLRAAGNQWLLEGACAIAAQDSDPADWAGAPLERQPAGSAEQRALRRLGAEIEMWLADLPLNERRRRQGRLPVNLLWMWGGGTVPAPGAWPVVAAAQLHGAGDDAWLAGCARLAGGALLPVPDRWSAGAPDQGVVVLPSPDDAAQLETLEADWFDPALADLRAGRVAALRLRLGRRLFTVRQGWLRRLLRRPRPWWEATAP